MKKSGLVIIMLSVASVTFAQDIESLSLKKPVSIHGGLSFNNTFYSGGDSLVKRDPYMFTLCGQMNVNIANLVNVPMSFAISNTSKTYTQSFNRFQLAPSYKWVKLYLGKSCMNFSPYTLAGHEFSGVGVELTPEHWYVAGMYGRLNKAVEYDSIHANYSSVAYKRMGYAAKVQFNSSKGTTVGATFFHGKDEAGSLKDSIPDYLNLHAKENTAISANFRQQFLKYFFIEGEYAFSKYNSEIRANNGEAVSDANFIDKVFNKEGNDQYVDAVNASAGYAGKIWGLKFCFERVAPNYQTLGGYYFVNDIEDFTLSPSLHLFKGMLNVDGKIGWEYNNLDNLSANNTHRVVGNANVSFRTKKAWTASVGYSNFTTYTKYRQTAYPYYVDELDSLNFYQMNQTFNGNVGYSFGSQDVKDNIILNGVYQTGNTKQGDEVLTYQHISSASLSFMQNYIKRKLSWAAYFSANYADASSLESFYWGPGANGQKKLCKDKLTIGASCTYNVNDVNRKRYSSIINSNLSIRYDIKQIKSKYGHHSVEGKAALTNWLEKPAGSESYEFLGTLNYTVSF